MISSFGIHPKFVLTATSNYASSLTAILKSNPQAHIGEIGLDFRNLENDQVKKKQIQMFGEQLQLAIGKSYSSLASYKAIHTQLRKTIPQSALNRNTFILLSTRLPENSFGSCC